MSTSAWLSRVGAIVLATAGAGVVSAPAYAASTGVASVKETSRSASVRFQAGSGRANRVVITRSGRTVTIDDRYPIRAGTGCRAVKRDKTKVRCTTAKAPTFLSVGLGGRSDSLVNRTAIASGVSGGTGNDVITGGSGADELYGDSGSDRLHGGSGRDRIDGGTGHDRIHGGTYGDHLQGGLGNDLIDGGSGNDHLAGDAEDRGVGLSGPHGADILRGGAGRDTVTYATHDKPVTVDLDGAARDDGQAGEHDTVGADVEDIDGSPQDDTLTGNAAANRIAGNEGADTIRGGRGNDRLDGDHGADRLDGEAGDDTLIGNEPSTATLDQRADQVVGGANDTGAGDLCRVTVIDVLTACERVQTVPTI
ncbi:calcium-binding protein [Actinoplanes teichomyceticus]|uniref:Hemolysin type calcium-binding protein n=1 Tax=Actinoplanes teichomyceticus TaxID=1867 RepID=A0A561WQP6_ACTTI|nr:calcium-binding protein [Actinoplanes teichomyceticus]TWG26190.1 hemolysin type calcium-binding protein [Actinoplanes teichomyceticus]GIF11268.1 hypothetical protein Ate01nite_13000 [Actinoplanes teichomyceticus]